MSADLQRAMGLARAIGADFHRCVSVRIDGEPISKARARVQRYAGVGDVERRIADAFQGVEMFGGNVAVAAIFYRSNHHRIDTDNLIKTVLDGITLAACVWPDDSHVTAVAGVAECDPDRPRTVIAVAPHTSSLLRGTDTLTHTCQTCGQRYRPHGTLTKKTSRFCSRACTATRRGKLLCEDCGGPTSAPHVRRCRDCAQKARRA